MASIDFQYTQEQLRELANYTLETASKLGATSAQVEISETVVSNVDILNSAIENLETNYDRTMALNVYRGNQRGCVGITGTINGSIESITQKAFEIAKYTEEDPYSAIAEKNYICKELHSDLQIYHPIEISNQDLIEKAKNIEHLGLTLSDGFTISNGASVSFMKHNFVVANTNGLNLGYSTTRYNTNLALIGHTILDGMRTDYWYSSSRDFNDLSSDTELAQTAIDRLARKLNRGRAKTGKYPVIFESTIAKSIIDIFLGAIRGSNLYRRLSFMNDSINKPVFPSWVNIYEDPFVVKGLSSCYFDDEGIAVSPRAIVKDGHVNGYILSSYTARKLGLAPTGNAGGYHNIFVSSNTTETLEQLAIKINQGLIVIETIGDGVNMVTGEYSVGASGLWVENGEIQHFVNNITISGNLKEIFMKVVSINEDKTTNSSLQCGSMLVDGITISG